MRIALLGAESTGKTQLALGIAQQLRAQGHAVTHVPEVLREWCEREGRTPRPEEQQSIAQEQARRADASPPGNWLVADTTPLMIAIYSDMLFDDKSIYGFALAHQKTYDLTFVTGLDLPWVADGHMRDGPHVREPVDALLRAALARGGIAYRLLYGSGPARLANAMDAIMPRARTGQAANWQWTCDKCNDPDCEHRLFRKLIH